MIKNSLETIEYVDNCKHQVIRHYKEKYKGDFLKPKTMWIVVRRILQIVGKKGEFTIDRKYRRKVVLKTLNQMSSDSYIESIVSWVEFNELNNLIDNLNMDDLEEEAYKDEETLCNRCC